MLLVEIHFLALASNHSVIFLFLGVGTTNPPDGDCHCHHLLPAITTTPQIARHTPSPVGCNICQSGGFNMCKRPKQVALSLWRLHTGRFQYRSPCNYRGSVICRHQNARPRGDASHRPEHTYVKITRSGPHPNTAVIVTAWSFPLITLTSRDSVRFLAGECLY